MNGKSSQVIKRNGKRKYKSMNPLDVFFLGSLGHKVFKMHTLFKGITSHIFYLSYTAIAVSHRGQLPRLKLLILREGVEPFAEKEWHGDKVSTP
jgi:hypothetical protein